MGRLDATERLTTLLAVRLPLAAIVLVSPVRRARVLWHDGLAEAVTLAELTELAHRARVADSSAVDANHGTVIGLSVRDHTRAAAAVIFAVRRGEQAWSDSERDALCSAFSMIHDDLLALAGRPRPGPNPGVARVQRRFRTSIEQNQFVLLYQPEVDLRTGQLLAVEALLRWDHPVLGRLEPESFIPFAEQSDLITILGNWVIDHALAEFAGWAHEGLALRINVSPAQLAGNSLADQFARALADTGVAGSRICVEFTETSARSDVVELAATVRALHALGITTALDDLATGYSTLSRLRMLPVDVIKIDRSLVIGIDDDARARAIVRSLLTLGAELGLDVVAEGIERAEEAQTLLELGCRRGQGHHFARPQDASMISQLLCDGEPLLGGDRQNDSGAVTGSSGSARQTRLRPESFAQ